MRKIALIGYGKMGRVLDRLAPSLGLSVVARVDPRNGPDDFDCLGLEQAEVCIDFTRPDVVLDNAASLAKRGKNLVVGTTGFDQAALRRIVEEAEVGALYAPNFSIGVYLFHRMVQEAARLMAGWADYDVALAEQHHRHKRDRPSGTALSLQHALQSELGCGDLEISSLRCGAIPGTHTVTFDSSCDTITLAHQARSREGFALGALRAAQWMAGRQGFYTLDDMMRSPLLCR
ncbi:MAG: 4-hydroxy-tetrahydrodipicolinate reductase [Chlamydiia bacterium]|nr:4-hydroxy-tetrahydrodipicolinate reductase [Chlamydiia bacterium]